MQLRSCLPQKLRCGPLQEFLASGIQQTQLARWIKSKNWNLDLFNHALQQCGSFYGSGPMLREQISERIYL